MPTKYTTEYFINRARKIHGNYYDYNKVVYVNSLVNIIVICPIDGEFKQTPSKHLAGQGCPKCGFKAARLKKSLTIEQFVSKARNIHGNKFDYSRVIYVNAHTEVIIICPVDGEFTQTPNAHLSGRGCPKCGKKSTALKNALTKEIFIERVRKIHGDKYDYSKVIYVNYWTGVIIICPIHGEFKQTPNNHLIGKGCPSCSRNKKSTTEEFIKKSKEIHGNKYDYGKVDYVNNSTEVPIVCPIDGVFLQIPASHLAGNGCPVCGGSKRLTKDEFVTRAIKIHGNKYDYSRGIYKNFLTNIAIVCPECGEFLQTPCNHLSGQGCPNCKTSNGEKLIAKILDKNNIEYKKQKSFPDCINPKTNRRLKYDFYVSKYNMLIEYNGMQHYKYVERWHKEKQTLKYQQYRDILKQQYALSHGYKFLVIKYDNKNIEKTIMDALSIPTFQP